MLGSSLAHAWLDDPAITTKKAANIHPVRKTTRAYANAKNCLITVGNPINSPLNTCSICPLPFHKVEKSVFKGGNARYSPH